jgi:hypothetical protein
MKTFVKMTNPKRKRRKRRRRKTNKKSNFHKKMKITLIKVATPP